MAVSRKEYLREYRKRTGNAATKKYEKTPNGFLLRLYHNMQSRVKGIQKMKAHLYEGKEILSRESFYDWAKSSEEFYDMFATYEASGYDMKLAPTVDRIDSNFGYTKDNMRWLTHSENSSEAGLGREYRKRTEEEKQESREAKRKIFGVNWYNEKTNEAVFKSCKEMSEIYGISIPIFSQLKNGKLSIHKKSGWRLL